MREIGCILLLSIVLFGSCVRVEIEPCPPLTVNIAVKDKNYFNVDKMVLEERKSEDLAFKEYVSTLYYLLRDAATGEVVEKQGLFEVTGDEKTFPITSTLPHGKYVLTVWGGLSDNTPLGDDPLTAILHRDNQEDDDFYLTNDTLLYDAWNYDYTVEMERTKGKLILQVENLPDDVNYSDKVVGGLFQNLNFSFKYTDLTEVHTETEWSTSPKIVTKTILAPSTKEKGSALKVNFYDKPDRETPILTPDVVNVTMKRNELTVLRYVYDNGGDFIIYIRVNDNWEVIHNMTID